TDHWAVSLILSRTGDSPALIPAEARPVAEAPATKPPSASAPPAPGEDVFASYNRSVTLDDVVGWHVAHDHKVHHREPGRVEFTRGGKEGGQSFNVKLVDGMPLTYSFSDAAGMPPNKGLNPSQMRCVYELGACDKVTMNRFSDTLRAELGWPARGKAGPRVVINGQAAPAAADPLAGDIFRTTDMANAKRFAADHAGRALFVKDWNCWYVWDGRRWVEDKGGTSSLALAKETVRRMTEQAAEAGAEAFRRRGSAVGEAAVAAAEKDQKAAEDALKWAKKSQDARLLAGMLKLARTDLAIDKGSAQFDTARYLLNCPNGTVNLRTGELRPHDPTDYITKLCPTNYDPAAAAPRYRKFLAQILPDAAVADYVREVGGYAATGEVSDQSVHFFVGDGSNGKSVLLKLWAEVLGEYAAAAPPEVIADRGESRHPTEKMILRGARLVVCHESAEGDTLNEQRVKALTGSDAITARGMKENFSTFSPTHTLVLATNVLPTVTGDDHAIWRRVRLVRFDVRFWTEADRKLYPDRDYPDDLQADAMLGERLHQEAEGVLADLVANAAEFYGNEQRLRPPAAVSALVKEYRESEDHMGRFFRGWQADINAAVSARTFYELFAAWFKREVDNAAHRCPTNRAFGLRAARVFGKPHETNRGRFYGASERPAAA
ncbi:MAG TPA: phage/plasmid primase, P4 family, partial [Urbifossiella sp.]|nr:phage/plasmid primase, P4 family [Urbifossiella sp.]